MPVAPDWIEHRRGDGELLGWMRPERDGFVAVDRLGRPVTDAVDWLPAEETLESTGIGYLAEPQVAVSCFGPTAPADRRLGTP